MEEQAEQHQKWWQQLKQHRVAIRVGAIVLVVVIVLIIIGYWFDWTGFNGYNKITVAHTISGTNAGTVTKTEVYQPGKGLWDWLQLLGILAIPVVVGFGAAWFTFRQTQASEANRAQQAKESEANREKRHQTDIEIADKRHEAAFRPYLEKMSELLIEWKLDESKPGDKVRKIARVQTLTVLLGLDAVRKGNVLQFLYEAGLISGDKVVINLQGADLNGANLTRILLNGVNLSRVDLPEYF